MPLNKRAARSASRAFERRLTKKFYAAILRGRVEAEAGDLDLVTVDWAVGEDSEGDPGVRMCLEVESFVSVDRNLQFAHIWLARS